VAQRKNTFWLNGQELANQRKGGLGNNDLRKMNESLLCKWWWKSENNDVLWQKIVKKKYIKMIPIAQLKRKPTNSPVWNDLLKVRDLYRKGRVMRIGNGMSREISGLINGVTKFL